MNTKSKPLISVIIPVYNIRNYLPICMDSLFNQTYQKFEVILVDDGSSDGSSELCDSFSDNRVKVIHQKNHGVSDARNVGLKHAKGDALMFVDGDDFLDQRMIEQLVKRFVLQPSIDVVSCRYVPFFEGDNPGAVFNEDDVIVSGDDAVEDLLYQRKIVNGPFGKLYRASLFDDVRFHKDIAFAEDLLMNFEILTKARMVIVSNAAFYFYLLRQGSAINKKFSPKRMDGLKAADRIVEKSIEAGTNIRPAENRAFMEASFILMSLPLFGFREKEYYDECIERVKALRANVAADTNSPTGYRTLARIAKISVTIFVILIKLKAAQPRVKSFLKRIVAR